MIKRERAIAAAARTRFLACCTGLSLPHITYHWDEGSRSNQEWIKDQIFAMSAAITEYERVMGEVGEGEG